MKGLPQWSAVGSLNACILEIDKVLRLKNCHYKRPRSPIWADHREHQEGGGPEELGKGEPAQHMGEGQISSQDTL